MSDTTHVVPPSAITAIFVTKSLAIRNALIHVIREVAYLTPDLRRDSESAKRAIYAPATTSIIINTAADFMHTKLGKHSCALALGVHNPTEAAEKAKSILFEYGFNADVDDHAEPEFPKGFLVFVSCPEFQGIVLLFRQNNPPPEVVKAIPPAEKW